MTLTGTSDLDIIELVIYLVLFPIMVYLGYRHGSAGVLGYFYLNVTCAVRIVADIVSLLPANRDATHPSIATAVLSSVGLSPLMLALSGFVHEAHVKIVDATLRTTSQAKRLKGWLWFAQLQIHGVAIVGMVLAIVGSIKLVAPQTPPLTDPQIQTNEHLRSAGAILLLLLWAALTHYGLYIMRAARKIHARYLPVENIVILKQVTVWLLLALPFVGLRCVYSVLYTFDHKDSKLNPITGALWVKVVFVVLPSLGAVLALCVSGGVSQNWSTSSQRLNRGSGSDENIHSVATEVGRKE